MYMESFINKMLIKRQKKKTGKGRKVLEKQKQNVLTLLGVATAPTPVKIKSWEEIAICPALR